MVKVEAAALAKQHDREIAVVRGEIVGAAGVKSIEAHAAEIIALGDAERYELLALISKLAGVEIVTPMAIISAGGT